MRNFVFHNKCRKVESPLSESQEKLNLLQILLRVKGKQLNFNLVCSSVVYVYSIISAKGFILQSNPHSHHADSKYFSASINLLNGNAITWSLRIQWGSKTGTNFAFLSRNIVLNTGLHYHGLVCSIAQVLLQKCALLQPCVLLRRKTRCRNARSPCSEWEKKHKTVGKACSCCQNVMWMHQWWATTEPRLIIRTKIAQVQVSRTL